MSIHFKNLAALKSALKVEHDTVMSKLRRYKPGPDEFHYKYFRSRGMRIIAPAKNRSDNRGHSRFHDGQWEWTGTKHDLEDAVRQAIADGYERLYIDEGFDGAIRMADWNNTEYEPCIEEYEVCIWSKDATDDGETVQWGLFPVPLDKI